MNQITLHYGSEINFITVYKDLLENSSRFNFLHLKSGENYGFPIIEDINKNKKSEVEMNQNMDELNKIKENLKNYTLESVKLINQYFDFLKGQLEEKIKLSGLNFNFEKDVKSNGKFIPAMNQNYLELMNSGISPMFNSNIPQFQPLFDVSNKIGSYFPYQGVNQTLGDSPFGMNNRLILENMRQNYYQNFLFLNRSVV